MEVGGQERQARIRPSYLQSESGHLVSDQGGAVKIEPTEVQVTGHGHWIGPDHKSLEFEIATLATDGSGFSGAPSCSIPRLCD